MKRVVGYVVGLAVLFLLVLAPASSWNTGSADASQESTSITSYVAEFDLAKNGDLDVVETLDVDFPGAGKHGIFRFWDRADDSAPKARRTPHDIAVTMDGEPVTFELLSSEHGRFTQAKIGSATRTVVPGVHTYVISYRIDGVIEPGTTGARSQFYWNLIPGGWRQAIDRSELTVHLPVAAQDPVACAVGAGKTGGCEVQGAGTDTLTVTTGALAPNTPVTIKAGLDMATPPAGETRPWIAQWDRVLGPNLPVLVVVLLLALLAGALGWVSARRSWETTPGYPLMYAPPEGIGPAQAKYILTESIDRKAYIATLMYAAERGAVDLSIDEGAWSITDKAGAAGWTGLDPVTGGVAHLLSGPGTTFTASRKDVAAGLQLKTEIASFESNTRAWARDRGLLVSTGLGGLGSILVIASGLAALAIAIFNPFGMTAVALIPGLFAVFGASLLATGASTKRTVAGRDLWSRVGGFHRILSTDSSQERFDFSGRKELYTAYIPWAVALGCADEWAAKYRVEMGTEPPAPSYIGGYYAGALAGGMVGSMVDNFSSTVDGAISSYQATQTSSSSGGGGFSGGGGGGGGGGGSW